MALPTPRPTFHVSKNRLDGSLCDTPLEKLLRSCRDYLITGTVRITTQFSDGVIELRAGMVDSARLGDDLEGEAAVRRMKRLSEGMYELTQRLPDLDGTLGDAATCEGDLATTKLVEIMRLCEDQALSCTITIISDFDRGEIIYKAGEIAGVTLNGRRDDEDAIVQIVEFRRGRFRIEAPALPDEIDGWPATSKDPTTPFHLHHVTAPPRQTARGTGAVAALPGIARSTSPVAPAMPPTPPTASPPPPQTERRELEARASASDSSLRLSTARALARHLSSEVVPVMPSLPLAAEPLRAESELDLELPRRGGWPLAVFALVALLFVAGWIALVVYASS